MKKLLSLLIFAVALTASAITPPDGINGDALNSNIAIRISGNGRTHIIAPSSYFLTDTEVLTVDFAEPGVEYSVTVTNLSNNIYLTDYSCSGCIPLPF